MNRVQFFNHKMRVYDPLPVFLVAGLTPECEQAEAYHC